MIVVNGTEYEIVMYGFIFDNKLLFELPGYSKEDAQEIFSSIDKMEFINSDGVKTDYSSMRFDGFLDGDERTMVILK